MKKQFIFLPTSILFAIVIYFQSCKKNEQNPDINELKLKLSEYNIFIGSPNNLTPASEYKLYELASTAFTDFAEKQRLIKLPSGTSLTFIDGGLPSFPEGTLIVKTFFYYNDKRDISKGKKNIETRILIKKGDTWLAGTYRWNNEQNEGLLLETGQNQTVNWINENGEGKVISYHIPSNVECATCHQSGSSIIPIGPKLRNLNRIVLRYNTTINQLHYFQNEGMINSFNPLSIDSIPNWQDSHVSLEKRARAYLDINCSHCHSQNGNCSQRTLRLSYETPLGSSNISGDKDMIESRMERGNMPKLGATVIDQEGLALIKEYLKTL